MINCIIINMWFNLLFPTLWYGNNMRIYTFGYGKRIQINFLETESISIKVTHDYSYQFSSIAQSCPNLCDPMSCSTPGFPVHHQLPELAQTSVHWVGDAIQLTHPLPSPSPPAFNLSQHQGLFQWVSSLHQMAKVLEFQLQHQSFQWIFRTDFI